MANRPLQVTYLVLKRFQANGFFLDIIFFLVVFHDVIFFVVLDEAAGIEQVSRVPEDPFWQEVSRRHQHVGLHAAVYLAGVQAVVRANEDVVPVS